MLCIAVVPGDDVVGVYSLRSVVDHFHEGIICYNSGTIHVILGWDASLESRIEDTHVEKQKRIEELGDISNTYSVFIIHRNRQGEWRVLPKNMYFCSICDDMAKAIGSSGVTRQVMLKDIKVSSKNNLVDRDISVKKLNISCRKVIVPADSFWNVMLRTEVFHSPISQPTDDVSEEPAESSLHPEEYDQQQFLPFPDPAVRQVEGSNHVLVTNPQQDSEQHAVFAHDYSRPALYRGTDAVVTSQPSLLTIDHATFREDRSVTTVPPRYPRSVDYNSRVVSFSMMWNLQSPNPEQLANAGFFFKNEGDLVRCFQCGIGLKDFSEGDDPLLEHVRHSGECPYLFSLLGSGRLTYIKTQLQATDPEYNRQIQRNVGRGGFAATRYRHPEYETLEARLATFRHWPANAAHTPLQLAEAGLYYTGVEDHVRCFACDGGLRRWDSEDDPWTEHCRWFPACPYCIEQKGEEYIALVQVSVDQQELGASGGDLENDMERLRISEAETQSFYSTHRIIFTDMGFTETEVKEALQELRNRGITTPEIGEIVDLIEVIKERKEFDKAQEKTTSETPLEENQRLKGILLCIHCHKNTVNALFLPCTHIKLCMSCAEPLRICPVCQRTIREKIKTFLV